MNKLFFLMAAIVLVTATSCSSKVVGETGSNTAPNTPSQHKAAVGEHPEVTYPAEGTIKKVSK